MMMNPFKKIFALRTPLSGKKERGLTGGRKSHDGRKVIIRDIVARVKSTRPAIGARPALRSKPPEPKRAGKSFWDELKKERAEKEMKEMREAGEPPRPAQSFEALDAPPIVKSWQPEKPNIVLRFLRTRIGMITLGALGVGIAALLLLFTVFARATIMVRPVAAEVTVPPLAIAADSKSNATNYSSRTIPGLRIEVEKTYSETFSSSGKKQIEEFARGRVRIYNAYSSSPQQLVQRTRFVDPDGKTFLLTGGITIPGAKVESGKIIPSSIVADVIASKPGSEYNISPTQFIIPGFESNAPKYEGFYGKSEEAFSGGFKGEAAVVTVEDLKTGQERVSQKLFDDLRSSLKEKIPAGDEFIALNGAQSVLITGLNYPKAEERGETFNVEGRGRAAIILFKKADLFALLNKTLLSPERPAFLLENVDRLTFNDVRFNDSDGKLSFILAGEALAVRDVSVEEIRAASLSKNTAALEEYLRQRPEIAGFTVKIFPPFRWRTPSIPERVSIKIELPGSPSK